VPVNTETLTIGLRFPRSQIRMLRNLIISVRTLRPKGVDVGLYEKALESAEAGEPLVVLCSNRGEAEMMADGFVRLGLRRPEVDVLG
jgi:hypothetical protein